MTMKNVSLYWGRGLFQVTFAVIVGVLCSVAIVSAATTISTNIQTDGTLSVTGNASTTMFSSNGPSYFGGTATVTVSTAGAVTMPSTLSVTGLATLLGGATTTSITLLNGEVISNATDGVVQINGIASSTSITLLNGETITNATDGVVQINGIASSTSITLLNGETITNATDGTIQLGGIASTTSLTLLNGETITNATDGTIQLGGIASTTSLTLLNGETITNATDGTIAITATNVTFNGTASTTNLRVGNDIVPSIAGMIFGYCNLTSVTVNATSTAYANCAGATGVTSSYSVFVQATSSLPAGLVVTAASSTATTGTINVLIMNSTAGANTATGAISLNYWAVR